MVLETRASDSFSVLAGVDFVECPFATILLGIVYGLCHLRIISPERCNGSVKTGLVFGHLVAWWLALVAQTWVKQWVYKGDFH